MRPGVGVLREGLLRVVGRGELLAGRVMFFDLHRPMDSRAHLNVAREAAQEADDPPLASAALGHMAFVAADKRNFQASSSYLANARKELARHDLPAIRSWLSAAEAELSTNAGGIDHALSCLEAAEASLSAAGLDEPPRWFDFFDERRLGGFAGFTLRKAGRTEEARTWLEEAIAPDPRTGPSNGRCR